MTALIAILAISLSVDALGIGISYGLRKIKIKNSAKVVICIMSFIFTSVAIFIGELIEKLLSKDIDKIISFLMLFILGLIIIIQSFWEKQKPKKSKKSIISKIVLKRIGITIEIIRNPIEVDKDKSKKVDALEALYLGTALSIDSFAAGMSQGISGMNMLLIPLLTCICQILFLCAGTAIGSKIKSIKRVNSQIFTTISGLLLVFLALIRWFC